MKQATEVLISVKRNEEEAEDVQAATAGLI